MNCLLDTHVCIWVVAEPEKLSGKVIHILENTANKFWVSRIRLLEIGIKKKTARIEEFDISFPAFVNTLQLSGYSTLPLKDEHLETYTQFEFDDTHRDPFDRYLIATALYENLTIITKDEKFRLYAERCKILW